MVFADICCNKTLPNTMEWTLSKEFYVCFFDELWDSLITTFKTSSEVGQLSTSQHQALIKRQGEKAHKELEAYFMNVDA